jgi:GNAT superfamily N-acetyltransferase
LPQLLDISLLSPSEFKKLAKNFNCINKPLNEYLQQYAYTHSVKQGISKTYLLLENDKITSYITLALDIISFSENDNNYDTYKNLCNLGTGYKYPIPSIKIARLATDLEFLKQGYATILFQYAEIRGYITQIQEGCRLITVDAKKNAVDFYKKIGFRELSNNNSNKETPMLFTLKPIKKLDNNKKNEFKEYCSLFNLKSEITTFENYFSNIS